MSVETMDHHLMIISVFICICSASVAMVGNDALLFGIFDNVRERTDAPLAAKKNHLLFSYLSNYQNSIFATRSPYQQTTHLEMMKNGR